MRAAAAAAVGQQQQPATTTAGAAAVASNGVKKGTPREVGEGCCKKYGENTGQSYEQRGAAAQARHSTGE